jgi:DNA-binding beta-propeller fold protein YncE
MMQVRIAIGAISLALLLNAATTWKVVARYPVPGDGGFDYITLDQPANRLYLSHGTQVDVVDATDGRILGTISGTPGVHGIAVAAPAKHGFTSNGGENKVTMFDTTSLEVIKKIDVGKGPDGIYYEPSSKRIFTNNHGSHDVTAIDSVTGDVVGTVKVEADGEQPVIGSNGNIYLNGEDTDDVVVFDPKTLKVVQRFPLGLAKTPTGLAYDAKSNRLFIACREKPMLIVMDAASGKTITSLPIAAGADWAEFDADAGLIFVSTSPGIINVFHQKSADEYEDAGSITTQQGSRTMAFDHKTKKIFLPSVEYEMRPNADPTKQPRRVIKPGTFNVLVVAR